MQVSHILVACDLSEESQRTFPHAQELARDKGAKITLLHVVEDLKVAPHGAPFAPRVGDPDAPVEAKQAHEELEKLRSKLGDAGEVEIATAIGEDVGAAVARYAQENGCDLILVSTHGRQGFRRLVLGSDAESVLRHAHVPVLCIPRVE